MSSTIVYYSKLTLSIPLTVEHTEDSGREKEIKTKIVEQTWIDRHKLWVEA